MRNQAVIMESSVQRPRRARTANPPQGGQRIDPRRRDVIAAAAAAAHVDAEGGRPDRDAARRFSTSRRTVNRWTHDGPPAVREFSLYLLHSPDPYRVAVDALAIAKQHAIARKSTPDLIADYRALMQQECRVEAEDRMDDVQRGVSWLDRAAASARDAAVDAEKAACEREFAARGVTEAEVFGGGR